MTEDLKGTEIDKIKTEEVQKKKGKKKGSNK